MYDLIIKNAKIVSPSFTTIGDIGIKDGIIRNIGVCIAAEGALTIDVQEKYVLPGGIEAHMHCQAPFQGCKGAHTFFEQSMVAAYGGVTTFMDFANMSAMQDPYEQVMKRVNEMSEAAIDYSVHGKILTMNDMVETSLKRLVSEGFPTFKMFMTYKKEGVMSSDETLLKAFKLAKRIQAMPMLHCESNAIAENNLETFIAEGRLKWKDFPQYKPVLCEAEAFERAVQYARYTGTAIIIVHTTNGVCLESARRAHQERLPVYVETGTHYLTLFENLYKEERGYLAICSPPLRTPAEAIELWKGLQDGTILLTGSDDCTFDTDEKTMFLETDSSGKYIQDFTKVVNGLGGIEVRLPILLSEGVHRGRLTINQVCALTSTNIAKLYGCYPKKGIIAPGADADLVVVGMNKEMMLSRENLHSKISYSLFENITVKGFPIMTIANGRVLVNNDEFFGEKYHGKLIRRSIDQQYLTRYGHV